MQSSAPVFYRSLDPISNLVVRCSLRQVRGPAVGDAGPGEGAGAPPPAAPGAAVDAPERKPGAVRSGSGSVTDQESAVSAQGGRFSEGDLIQVVDVPWQGKLFGPQCVPPTPATPRTPVALLERAPRPVHHANTLYCTVNC